ncbi:transglycosylase SLT domain protein [gamma proteobacterium HTCC5015]|nr:transglycosylase SLT domain protein [gamma proteobacterium HTCC5015]
MRALLITLSLALTPLMASGEETYIYQESDGTRWFTDRHMHGDGWQLIDRIGRPTATKSCKGMTEKRLAQRASRYASLIDKYASTHELDPLLVRAVIRVESCFDRRAVSRAGAQGLMQLMPKTADYLGVLDSFNADLNIEAGTRYLRRMLDRFEGDLNLGLAAYNAGPHNVKKYGGIPPFRETQNYVKRINRYYRQYLKQQIQFSESPSIND